MYRLSELREYEAALAGKPPPPPLSPEQERWLTARQVRERYGNVSEMWLWRRRREAEAAPDAA
jgi:hypothetical protein